MCHTNIDSIFLIILLTSINKSRDELFALKRLEVFFSISIISSTESNRVRNDNSLKFYNEQLNLIDE